MRLISCYIENFGALSGREFVFDKNPTVIAEGNGSGKTTLAAFIRAMFYGLPSYRSNTKTFDDRQRYLPFNGGRFGGNLTFERGGKEFKIIRFFDKKSGTGDELAVYCGAKKTDELGSDIGKAVFGVDENSFLKTAFFGAETDDGATGDIGAKLNKFVYSDVGNPTNALKILEAKRKALKAARGGGGLIDRLKAEKRDREDGIARLEDMEKELDGLYAARRSTVAEIAELGRVGDGQNKRRLEAERRAACAKFSEDAVAVRGEIALIRAKYPCGFPRADELAAAGELLEKIAANKAVLSSSEKDRARTRGKKGGAYAAVAALFILIIVAVAALFAVSTAVGAAVVAVGIIGVIVDLAVWFVGRRCGGRAVRAAENNTTLKKELADMFGKYSLNINSTADIAAVTGDIQRVDALEAQAARLQKRVDEYASEYVGEADFTAADDVGAELEKKRRELGLLDGRIADAEADTALLPEKRAALDNLKEQIARAEERLFIISAAEEQLAAADARLKERYVKPVKDVFLRYLERVPAFSGERIVMDENFVVSFERGGAIRSKRHLSAGQLAICDMLLRLALIDNMYEREKPFLVMDDPFVNLDGENFENAAEFLKGLAHEIQIIYFCCHGSRKL